MAFANDVWITSQETNNIRKNNRFSTVATPFNRKKLKSRKNSGSASPVNTIEQRYLGFVTLV